MSAQARRPPAIGQRWYSKNTRHLGAPIVIQDVRGRSVVFRYVNGDGANKGGSKFDQSRDEQMTLDKFYGAYGESDPTIKGSSESVSYRKPPTTKKALPMPTATVVPIVTGLVKTEAGDPNFEYMDISPDLSRDWMKRTRENGRQRKVRPRRVAIYLASMLKGAAPGGDGNRRWKQTEPISLDKDGNVANGQHRLLALAESGLTIRFAVVRGVDDDAINMMDTGAPRSQADVLGMHGFPSVNALSAAVRGLVFLENYGTIIPTLRAAETLIDNASVLEYAQTHDDLLVGLRLGDRIHAAGFGGTGAWTVMMTHFYRIDAAKAEMFGAHIVSGAGLDKGHPALVLRNRIAQAPKGTFSNSRGRLMLAAMTIKAWNAYREGRSIEVLSYRPDGARAESFPVAK